MKLKYPYSSELKPTAMNTDYDMAELALTGQMKKVAGFIKMQTAHYKSKIANVTKNTYPAADGTELPFYEFSPREPKSRYPAILYFHGGGFMFPIQKAMMNNAALYASECKVKVFLPEYRIVPDVACETVVEDCYSMLEYVFQHAQELQVDQERVLLYGDSAGGCLAACVAIHNRDRASYPLRAQMLLYPVCDNESEKYPSVDQYQNAVWTKKANASMWKLYFHNGVNDIKHVVPMKNDCHGLPPAYIEPQEMDVLRDEAIAYSNRLKNADIPTECNLISGSYHGFDAELKSPLVKRVLAHRYDVIRKYLA